MSIWQLKHGISVHLNLHFSNYEFKNISYVRGHFHMLGRVIILNVFWSFFYQVTVVDSLKFYIYIFSQILRVIYILEISALHLDILQIFSSNLSAVFTICFLPCKKKFLFNVIKFMNPVSYFLCILSHSWRLNIKNIF